MRDWRRAALVLSVLAAAGFSEAKYGGCTDGVTCSIVHASGLDFQCRFAGQNLERPPVILLHGFPEWSAMYMPLMRALAAQGFPSMACNQRGYSPGASPEGKSEYFYDKIVDDVFALADAGFNMTTSAAPASSAALSSSNKFHLVAHDHGAMVGWIAAADPRGVSRILTYASLSNPHPDAFSSGLFGPGGDIKQQAASQYITMFVLNNSASLHGELFFNHVGRTAGGKDTPAFQSAAAFQKALWWYSGIEDAGRLAMPPLMSSSELIKEGDRGAAALRDIFGGSPNPGHGASKQTGPVQQPVLYVCGKTDAAILCNRPYALATSQYCKNTTAGGYQYLEVDCGHNLLNCSDTEQTHKVMDAVLKHVQVGTVGRAGMTGTWQSLSV